MEIITSKFHSAPKRMWQLKDSYLMPPVVWEDKSDLKKISSVALANKQLIVRNFLIILHDYTRINNCLSESPLINCLMSSLYAN